MSTSNTTNDILDDKTRHYLDSYSFQKLKLNDSSQWIADQVQAGKEVGQWLDGFRVHGKNKDDLSDIESIWEAVSHFSQSDLDFFVAGDTAYSIPEDAREFMKTIKGKDITLPSFETLTPYALNLYGKYLSLHEKISEATSCFSEALKKDPFFSEPYNNLGQLLWKVGKQREGFVLFAESLSKNPHLLIAQLNFFDAGMDLEEYESTLNVIKYLEEEIPDCVEFKYYKAICSHRLGQPEMAKSILQNILKEQPDDAEAQHLLQNYA